MTDLRSEPEPTDDELRAACTRFLGGHGERTAADAWAEVADELGCRSLALVAFGTGVGGFPIEEAAAIEVAEARRHVAGESGLERVVFAVRGTEALAAFEAALEA